MSEKEKQKRPVPIKTENEPLQDGALENIAGGTMIGLECIKCGVPIQGGALCEKCSQSNGSLRT